LFSRGSRIKKSAVVIVFFLIFPLLVTEIAHAGTLGNPFPVAATAGQEQTLSAAFDGTNYLVGIEGDLAFPSNITAQLISQSGTLVGSRIPVGRSGGAPLVAFDGTNYLMIWFDDATSGGQLYGVFISKSGIANAPFVIDPGPLSTSRDIGGIAFGGGKYMAVYYKTDSGTGRDIVYGRLVSPSGTVGNEIRISTGYGSKAIHNVAFDGANFFVVWDDHASNTSVKGRFVHPSGTPGTEITVKPNGLPNDNPLSVAFDGTNYLVVWTDEVKPDQRDWDVFGQLVTPAGALSGGRISISTAPGQQFGPFIAFDGTNYLVSWTDMRNDANGNWTCDAGEGTCLDVRGQYVSKSGIVVGSEFIISNAAGNQLGGFAGQAVNGKLLGLINTGVTMSGNGLAGGDVQGVFLTGGQVPEKIPMMNFSGSGMNLYLYDPISQAMDTVKQNNINGTMVSLNSDQTTLLYTEFLSETQNNGKTYQICLYNIASKATTCLATPTVEEDSAAFSAKGKILFIDKSDGVLKKMNPDGTNITTIVTPAPSYRFSVFWVAPDRQKMIAVEERRSFDYYTTNYSRLVMITEDGTRTVIKEEVLGQWNMLLWKADSSRFFYYYQTFNVAGGVYQGNTSHYAVIDVPGGTLTDLTGSAVGGKDENVCSFTKSGNLLSWMYHELYNGRTGALIASPADAPSMMEARVGFDMSGDIYYANLDGMNVRKFIESYATAGSCGSANGQAFPSAPTTNLCNAGTPTTVSGSGPWTWSCTGSGGGANDSCSANIQPWREDFNASVLDGSWQVVSGQGRYSLTDNPGYLRYYIEGSRAYSGSWTGGVASGWSPSMTLVRPFSGDHWVLRAKARYNIRWQGTGAQYQVLYLAFGDGGNHYLRISRGTDQWYNANVLTAELVIDGQVVASNNTLRAPADVVVNDWLGFTYWYEIVRHGPCVSFRYSIDGTNYTTVFSSSLAAAGVTQRIILDANVWTTAGSYTDWDYIQVDPTAIPARGDVNGDRAVNLADGILALKVMAGMAPDGIAANYPTCGADIDCDGKIGFTEMIYILQRIAGLRQD